MGSGVAVATAAVLAAGADGDGWTLCCDPLAHEITIAAVTANVTKLRTTRSA